MDLVIYKEKSKPINLLLNFSLLEDVYSYVTIFRWFQFQNPYLENLEKLLDCPFTPYFSQIHHKIDEENLRWLQKIMEDKVDLFKIK